jgi:glycosyltransferase involved in cell wall biosynthesis
MAISFGILSTFPPTQCGLATFSAALVAHLAQAGSGIGVVRVLDQVEPPQPQVWHQWIRGEAGGARRAAKALNRFDIALIQHEYGIFGGPDGQDVLEVLAHVRVPVVTVLHTVLTRPTRNQHRVVAEVVAASAVIVTMTRTARERLIAGWGTDPDKVIVIPHGAQANGQLPRATLSGAGRFEGPGPAGSQAPVILTWGLLGPGKGIEWAIEAMAGLADLQPRPQYQIVGQTHPVVVAHSGEAYRADLVTRVVGHNLSNHVQFIDDYLDGPTLRSIIRAADIVLLPYDSRDQVTSGVLVEAVVAGKPVVSTAFPHAVELLSGGAGLLVPQGDAPAIHRALRRLLTEPLLAAQAAAAARALAPSLLWPAVAASYIGVARSLASPDRAVA